MIDRRDNEVGLRLTTSRKAPGESGLFQRFALVGPMRAVCLHAQNPPLCLPFSSADMTLAARWAYMLGPVDAIANCAFDTLGQTCRTLPPRIGSHPVLDLAAAYVLDSHHLYLAKGDVQTSLARQSGAKSMKALRSALAWTPGGDIDDAVLIAVKLFILAEVRFSSEADSFA